MSVHVFGVRHHGPGCARSLVAALTQLAPDIVLVEGPPDAADVLSLIASEAMKPPVAILIYPADDASRAVFYPFAEFSPEWQALRYAHTQAIPSRFIDLPQSIQLALEKPKDKAEAEDESEPHEGDAELRDELELQEDPIGKLAEAAGYSDRELWWERQIEQRQDPTGLFDGIMHAMTALRGPDHSLREHEAQREAFMRQSIRAAEKEGFARIAVICGAWHAPALATLGPAKADQDLLKGLAKTKVVATWTPWTYSRLSQRCGYGAGVFSPAWYEHLWQHPEQAGLRWIAQAARLLRGEDLDASSASVIETVRLAEALAAMRDLPMAGLTELKEAVLSVLCKGEATALRLIEMKLEIGDRLGEVPPETPAVALQRDLEAQQKTLRLKPTTEIKTLDLDLRNDTDRARSRLLYRLRLLRILWGEPGEARGKSGTFHEIWKLQWQADFAISVIEASIWGNTIEAAAAAAAADAAGKATELPTLTGLLDQATLAGLPAAIEQILARLQELAAVAADVRHLMQALPPLARVARYGDVRGTDSGQVLPIIHGLLERAFAGLPNACASLDDDAANRMLNSMVCVQQTLDLLDLKAEREEWHELLRRLLDTDSVHGLVRGWCCRLFVEQRLFDQAELYRRARLALSPAVPVLQAAAWLEGLLRGSGLALVHQEAVWLALDEWICSHSTEGFAELLPLLRRAFSSFQPPERRAMAEKVKRLQHRAIGEIQPAAGPDDSVDAERAKLVLPVLAHILGVSYPATETSS